MKIANASVCTLLAPTLLAGCAGLSERSTGDERPPLGGAEAAHTLIQPEEKHFAGLWKLTRGVENAAEGYWSFAGDRLVLQSEGRDKGTCDRIFTLERDGSLKQISNGQGVTTCAYFLPGDQQIVYASTQAWMKDCPPRADMSRGYVWSIHPEYDIYAHDLASGTERALTTSFGYDAEATISPRGDRMVFTSTRSGDLELWTSALDGSDLRQVTDALGYDGGAFFSHDGQWLVFRSTAFTPGKEAAEMADYKALLSQWLVRPSRMEIMLIRPDGSERRALTKLGRASFAPFFFPNDRRVVFSTNAFDPSREGRDFDLAAVSVEGGEPERITTYAGFDGFPMFSPDGKWLVFASNRGGTHPRETNLFVARWKD
jgi:hypothetical protein